MRTRLLMCVTVLAGGMARGTVGAGDINENGDVDLFDYAALVHGNATYNCCPDDIVLSLTVEGNTLRLTEEEVLTMP